MTTFRTTVTFDFDVPDGTDTDEFHDVLRDGLEESVGVLNPFGFEDAGAKHDIYIADVTLETVRDISVEELDD